MKTDTYLLKQLLGEEFDVVHFDVTESTNISLLEAVKKGDADVNTVYIADSQSAGRGRLGRSFSSLEGGLYMSFCTGDLEHALSTVICGVAAHEALEEAGFSPKIKWVNDILIGSKKVCGILAQSVGDGKRAIIGVGLNLSKKDIPSELWDIADGLDSFSDNVPSKETLTASILLKYKKMSESLPAGRGSIISTYKSRLAMLGEWVTVLQTGETVKICDVDSTGTLITETQNGKLLTLNSGEISIRKIIT